MINTKKATEQRDVRISQTNPMFPDVESGDIFRIEINSLQGESLLFRKNAGVWEVSIGRDIIGELMRESEQNQEEESETVDETASTEDDDTGDAEETEDAEDSGDKEPESDETVDEPEPVDPISDTGPSGDAFRTFHKADPEKVKNLIDLILDLPQGQVVTSDPDQKSTFGVIGSITGEEVVFYDSQMNKMVEIIVGNPADAYTSSFVRKPDEDDIYKVPGQLQMSFRTSLIALRDKNIFNSSPEMITSVAVHDTEDGNEFNLTRSEGAWAGADIDGNNLELDAAKVDDLLSALGSLSATTFVDPMEEARRQMQPEDGSEFDENDPFGFLIPNVVIDFTTAADENFSLIVGKLEGSMYYAALSGNLGDIFKVSKSIIDSVSPDPAVLAPGAGDESGSQDARELLGDQVDIGEIEEGTIDMIPPEAIDRAGE